MRRRGSVVVLLFFFQASLVAHVHGGVPNFAHLPGIGIGHSCSMYATVQLMSRGLSRPIGKIRQRHASSVLAMQE